MLDWEGVSSDLKQTTRTLVSKGIGPRYAARVCLIPVNRNSMGRKMRHTMRTFERLLVNLVKNSLEAAHNAESLGRFFLEIGRYLTK